MDDEQRYSLLAGKPELRHAVRDARHPFLWRCSFETQPRADQLDDGMECGIGRKRGAARHQHVGAFVRDLASDDIEEPRLADARLTAHQHKLRNP